MKTYYVTFGQQYAREFHPLEDEGTVSVIHPDGFAVVEANSLDDARKLAFKTLGVLWAFIYAAGAFHPALYPMGELFRIHQDGTVQDSRAVV